MDTVFIRELPIDCVIGVHPHERASRQRIYVTVELTTDFTAAAASDRLDNALDYTAIATQIEQCAVAGCFQLIETLATRLAETLLSEAVNRVRIEVTKPAALPRTRQVGVRVERVKSGKT